MPISPISYPQRKLIGNHFSYLQYERLVGVECNAKTASKTIYICLYIPMIWLSSDIWPRCAALGTLFVRNTLLR